MKRNKYSLSHYHLTTMDMGLLIPVTWFEVLPGDTIQQATSALLRLAPMMAPIMHPIMVRIHHWFVPNRLLWDEFEDFITGGPDGTSVPSPPYLSGITSQSGTLINYLGAPSHTYSDLHRLSALPLRAYNLIWNEAYRDQDLHTESTVVLDSGLDSTTNRTVLRVCWEKDYFTTSRPWQQKGNEVTIPISGSIPIGGFGKVNSVHSSTPTYFRETLGLEEYDRHQQINPATADGQFHVRMTQTGFPSMYGITDQAGIDIDDLRLALGIQRYQEARARYGSRYVEYLRYCGVRSSDARLQQPEYLGGGRQVLQVSEVIQTAEGTNPVGTLRGHGIGAMRTNRYRRFFEEHGLVMTLMSVVPKSIYTQGANRKWFRRVKEDYYQRELAAIGEQEVFNKEVQVDHSQYSGVFGYQARYDEYRNHPSYISGKFEDATDDHWHMGRVFASDVALNQTFIEANPTKRVFADQNDHSLHVMTNHSIQARRMVNRSGAGSMRI